MIRLKTRYKIIPLIMLYLSLHALSISFADADIPATKVAFVYPITGTTVANAQNYVQMVNRMFTLLKPKLSSANLSVDYYDSTGKSLGTAVVIVNLKVSNSSGVLPSPHPFPVWTSGIVPSLPSSVRPQSKYDAYVGDVTGSPTIPLGWFAKYFGIPHVITVAPAPSFTSPAYPNTYRAYLGDADTGVKLKLFLQENKWKRFALFVSSEAQGVEFAQWIQMNLDLNIYFFDVYYMQIFQTALFNQQIDSYLADVQKKDYRIIVVQMTATYAAPLLLKAAANGMTGASSGRVWIGFQFCSLILKSVPVSAWPMLYGTSCISMQEPTENVYYSSLPYFFNDSTLVSGLNPQLLGAADSIEVLATASNILNTLSIPIDGSSLISAMNALNSDGIYNKMQFKNRDLQVGIQMMNFRILPDGSSAYYEVVRTAAIGNDTWTIIEDIQYYDGSTNVPPDRFYTFADNERVFTQLSTPGIILGLVFSTVSCTASYVALTGFLHHKQHLLQRVRVPSLKKQFFILFPWALITAFAIGVGNFAVMQLCISGFMNDYNYNIQQFQVVVAILLPFFFCLTGLILISSEVREDMHIIGKNGSKSDDTDDFQYSKTNNSLLNSENPTTANTTTDATSTADQKNQKKERLRARKRANRSFCVWIANDMKYTFGMTNIRLLISSFLFTAAIIFPSDVMTAFIDSPTRMTVNSGAVVGEILVTSVVVHYFIIKMVFESAMVWRIITGLAFVVVPLIERVIAQTTTYEYHWNNDAENSWTTPDDIATTDNVLMTACGLVAGAALILVGLLIERLKLSRNTLDVMLLKSQITLKKLEDETKQAKSERMDLARSYEQTKRLLELLIHCRPVFREFAFAFTTAPGLAKATSSNKSTANNNSNKSNTGNNFYNNGPAKPNASNDTDTLNYNSNYTSNSNFYEDEANARPPNTLPKGNSYNENINLSRKDSKNIEALEGDAFPFVLFSLAANCAQLNVNMNLMEQKNELHMLQLFEDVAAALHRGEKIDVNSPTHTKSTFANATRTTTGLGMANTNANTPASVEDITSDNPAVTPTNNINTKMGNNNVNGNASSIAAITEDITLANVLTHPLCFDVFRDKMARLNPDICEHPIQLITLWLDIKYYRMISDVFVRRTIANGIFDTYFSSQAPHYIPGLQKLRPDVQRTLYSAATTLYDSVELYIFDALAPAYMDFKISFEFKFCALILGHPSMLHSRFRELLRIAGEKEGNNQRPITFSTNIQEMVRRIRDSPYLPHRSQMHGEDKNSTPITSVASRPNKIGYTG